MAGNGIRLCNLETLHDNPTQGFTILLNGEPTEIFLVNHNDTVTAWLDRCPHRGTPLAWQPDNYLDAEREHLICATHGALFRPDDGRCIAGPCAGEALTPVAIEIINNTVFVQAPPEKNRPDDP